MVSGRATGLRLATLLDVIAETEYEPLRAMMVKMLAYSVWQEHSEAVKAAGRVRLCRSADAIRVSAGQKGIVSSPFCLRH